MYYLFLAFLFLTVFLVIRLIVGKVIGDYKKRERVMNKSEFELFKVLQKKFGGSYIVLSKVRIEDFVDVSENGKSWGEEQALRGKIKSRHVDFLICDGETTEPKVAVELDGPSHTEINRVNRDNFISGLYKKIGLPLVRIKAGVNYAEEVEKIQDLL